MPLILKKVENSWGSLAVWQITEPEEFFFSSLELNSEDKNRILSEKLAKRRLEKLACRKALSELILHNNISIQYSQNKKPYIKGNEISFSHSGNMAAVAISNLSIGIDIEKNSDRFFKLYPRYMHKREIAVANTKNPEELAFYWCAKEAMFKMYDLKFSDLRNDLLVNSPTEGKIKTENHTKNVRLLKLAIEEYTIVVSYLENAKQIEKNL